MTTTELKKLAEAASLTGAQLVGMSGPEFAEAQRLKQQFRQIRPAAILKLLAINAELVEALEMIHGAAMDMRGEDFNLSSDQWRKVHAALAKAEGGEL